MANTTLTADIIAKAAVAILDNELVMAKKVFRGYEEDFAKKVNGYEVGETISIRKPTDYTVRDGAVMSVQDTTEGKTSITVNKRKGVDFKFSAQELTLNIKELSERAIKPAMVQLANQIDVDLHALYKDVPNWAGTPGELINSFADFAKAPERLDEYAVPSDERCSVLCPADHWALVGSQTSLFNDTINKPAYRTGSTGMVANTDMYMSQNVATHTVGADVSGTVNQAITASTISYNDVKNTNQQTITVASLDLNPGDVFSITDVWAVNPVTKARLSIAKQFTVVSYDSNTLVFSPAMIWTGAFQNIAVSSGVTDLNTKAITAMGTAGTNYRQNMVFHKNAFALVTVPLVSPPGAVDVGRQTYKGTSVRVIPVYDGVNDESAWRLDVLYGTKAVDPRLATRISGTS
jgi:ribosomal protein S4